MEPRAHKFLPQYLALADLEEENAEYIENVYARTVSEMNMHDPNGPIGRAMILRRSIELMQTIVSPHPLMLPINESEVAQLIERLCSERRGPRTKREEAALRYLIKRDIVGAHLEPDLYKANPTKVAAGCSLILAAIVLGSMAVTA